VTFILHYNRLCR